MSSQDAARWRAATGDAPADVRRAVATLVTEARADLADAFYEHMLASPEAAVFLDHDAVQGRLQPSMQRWLTDLFEFDAGKPAEAVVALQRHIGEVHARTQVPVHLVVQGMRLLKRRIVDLLRASTMDRSDVVRAIQLVGDTMDLALEHMSEAFARSIERSVRNDEAYRLYSATQNVGTERERQRAALLDWCQDILFTIQTSDRPGELPRLGDAEFGLWLAHKGVVMLDGAPELVPITTSIERIDDILLPRLAGHAFDEPAVRRELITDLQREVDALRFLLTTLFDRQQELEGGRDQLTRLLNRRFLPAVLAHEIGLHRRRSQLLAVLLADIDHFKHINDAHGHDAGDVALQQVATVVADQVRTGDFVFRYGGDELLVVLVETTPAAARRVAEAIRVRVEQTDLSLGAGRAARTTLSMGIALFDGHPDPQRLVTRADGALMEAKNRGRNRWAVADELEVAAGG